MKKLLMVIASSVLLIALAACGDTQSEDQVETDNNTEKSEEQAETDNDTEETEEEAETENNTEENESNEDEAQQDDQNEEDKTTKSNKENADYKEANTMYEESNTHVDKIESANMDVRLETNTPNKRILLFSDNNKIMYKTNYIKEKQRLKIIDIYEDKGQIFNVTI